MLVGAAETAGNAGAVYGGDMAGPGRADGRSVCHRFSRCCRQPGHRRCGRRRRRRLRLRPAGQVGVRLEKEHELQTADRRRSARTAQ